MWGDGQNACISFDQATGKFEVGFSYFDAQYNKETEGDDVQCSSINEILSALQNNFSGINESKKGQLKESEDDLLSSEFLRTQAMWHDGEIEDEEVIIENVYDYICLHIYTHEMNDAFWEAVTGQKNMTQGCNPDNFIEEMGSRLQTLGVTIVLIMYSINSIVNTGVNSTTCLWARTLDLVVSVNTSTV